MQKDKRKNTSALNIIITGRGCLLTLFMLMIGMLAGIAGTTFFLPQLFNFKGTETAIWAESVGTTTALAGWEHRLYATQEANLFLATQAAFAAVSTQQAQANAASGTQVALENAAALLQQTATQSAQNIIATQTANAVLNAEQMTQIALNYDATQAQLQQNATEVELNFQATRAALNTPHAANAANLPVSTPTATSTPMLVYTPTTNALLNFEDTFANGIDAARWNMPSNEAWRSASSGLLAIQDNAWLLTDAIVSPHYRLEVDLTPALAHQAEEYSFVLNRGENGGYTLVLRVEALKLRELILLDGTETQFSQTQNITLTGNTQIVILLENNQIRVEVNGVEIQQIALETLPSAGAVGVRFPAGASLNRIRLAENP